MVFEGKLVACLAKQAGSITEPLSVSKARTPMPCWAKKASASLRKVMVVWAFWSASMRVKAMREWSSTATCRARNPGCLLLPRRPPIAAPADLREACHALDVQVQQVARPRMFITNHRGRRVEVAPSAEPGPAQDAADRSWTCDLIAGHVSPAQLHDAASKAFRQPARAALRSRTTVHQALDAGDLKANHPLGGGPGADAEGGRLPRSPLLDHKPGQRLSTAKRQSGIL